MVQQSISLATALWRGLRMKCPKCGSGSLFDRYLKVAQSCPACGEGYHHHQADDFPAYLVVAVVGHAALAIILLVEKAWAPPIWLYAVIGLPLVTLAVLLGLQPIKGAVVAVQWHLGMFGFEASSAATVAPSCSR
jgi:uncharacterized protein (DUF983 family)